MDALHHTLTGNTVSPICLVFIHGFSSTRDDWRNQIAYFSHDYQLLSCDLRGHGQSRLRNIPHQFDIISLANDIVHLLKNLSIQKKIILVGHSMGVRVAAEVYTQLTDQIVGIVFVDCGYVPANTPDINLLDKQLFHAGYRSTMTVFFEQMFTPNTPDNIRRAAMHNADTMPEYIGRILLTNIMIYDYYVIKKALALITVPTLIIQSTQKCQGKRRSINLCHEENEWLSLIKKYVKQFTIKEVADTGHFVMLEKPDLVNAYLHAWIKPIDLVTF